MAPIYNKKLQTHTHILCFWARFPLLYSKAWMLLCMFRSKQQLSKLWYCLALFIEGQRTIILKVHEDSKTNRLRPSWVWIWKPICHMLHIIHPDQQCKSSFSLCSDLRILVHFKKIKLLFCSQDQMTLSSHIFLMIPYSEKITALYF